MGGKGKKQEKKVTNNNMLNNLPPEILKQLQEQNGLVLEEPKAVAQGTDDWTSVKEPKNTRKPKPATAEPTEAPIPLKSAPEKKTVYVKVDYWSTATEEQITLAKGDGI